VSEKSLSLICRIFAVMYAAGALGFASTPRLTFRLVTLDAVPVGYTPQAIFWNVLAVAMMTAIATACWLVSKAPRERAWGLIPVAVAKITSSGVAAAHLIRFHETGARAIAAIIITDFPLFLLTVWVWRKAQPSA